MLQRLLARLSPAWRLVGCGLGVAVSMAARGSACVPATPLPVTAVTAVDAAIDPAAAGAPASIPELLRFAPGVRVVQRSLHDFYLDTRGLEGTTERRVLVRIDGRDATVPLVGTPPWAALTFAGEDVERLALERGPASARYGGGAYSGVLDLVTRSPRQARSEVRLAAGEHDSGRAWATWAGSVGDGTHVAASGGLDRGRGFARSRVTATEYPGL
ncbi:MAG TPA: TonB-dependent receptor plug domain-containing protein, partial [Thermoanaerobaculia bacterium]|nr:TonB-dependent receptor plug domain-containing protein [Thermoanaerobaculia bacterium]